MAELASCNMWMFRKVRCNAYLKKIRDGRFIEKDEDGNCTYVDTNKVEDGEHWSKAVQEEDYDGTKNFLKTYYEYTRKEFVGVIVGLKMVTLTGYLVVETEYHYNGGEYTVVRKEPEDVRKCALVYYGCNKSRLVPICDLEILEDEENEQKIR